MKLDNLALQILLRREHDWSSSPSPQKNVETLCSGIKALVLAASYSALSTLSKESYMNPENEIIPRHVSPSFAVSVFEESIFHLWPKFDTKTFEETLIKR